MTESSPEQSESADQTAYNQEWDRLDQTGQLSPAQIRERLGPRPTSKSKETPLTPAQFPLGEDNQVISAEAIKPDPTIYDRDVLAQAHEDLSSGKRDNFNGLNQGDIAAEIDRRYQEDLNAQSTQAQPEKDDVVH